ncbi:MAG: ABC transporter ATP-binding protein [Candidatus Anammoxibacter sp.]
MKHPVSNFTEEIKINTFRKLSKYIKKYRRELILGIIALIITDLLGLCAPWLIKCAIDSFENVGLDNVGRGNTESMNLLVKYASLLVGAVTVQAVFRFFWRRYIFGLSRRVEYDLRNDYFSHLQRMSASFFVQRKTGDLMSRATSDMNAVREFLGLGFMILVDTMVTVSTCVGVMLVINMRLTFIALFPMLIICLLVMKFGKLIRKRYTAVQAQLAKISSMVQESMSGIRVVQAYVQENSEKRRFDKLNKEYIKKNLQLVKVSGILFPLLAFMSGISAAIVLWIGGKDVISGAMTLGSFVAFNGYLALLTWPMMAIGFMTNLMQRGAASMTRIDEILKVQPEICNLETSEGMVNISDVTSREWGIEFTDVNFMYPGTNTKALSNINLKIMAGSTVGIVGQVGSGKSTIGRLISRSYDTSAGRIEIGGADIKRIPINILRGNIGYVEQDPFLFADTIRENILFGCNNDQSSEMAGKGLDEAAWDAALTAGLERDLISFTDGIDTMIGERGVTLSGGQKQRVALARALLRKSKILILDDAFSSLDTSTENEILDKMKDIQKGTTTIIISHRISTVKDADLIIVIEQGRIIEEGTHQGLIDSGGFYCRLYERQVLEMDMGVLY